MKRQPVVSHDALTHFKFLFGQIKAWYNLNDEQIENINDPATGNPFLSFSLKTIYGAHHVPSPHKLRAVVKLLRHIADVNNSPIIIGELSDAAQPARQKVVKIIPDIISNEQIETLIGLYQPGKTSEDLFRTAANVIRGITSRSRMDKLMQDLSRAADVDAGKERVKQLDANAIIPKGADLTSENATDIAQKLSTEVQPPAPAGKWEQELVNLIRYRRAELELRRASDEPAEEPPKKSLRLAILPYERGRLPNKERAVQLMRYYSATVACAPESNGNGIEQSAIEAFVGFAEAQLAEFNEHNGKEWGSSSGRIMVSTGRDVGSRAARSFKPLAR